MSGNLAIDTHAPSYFSVHDIHSYYDESYIVQGVSFNVHEGEILALLGRNGAGKTSTLRSIARLDSPVVQRGEIWLDRARPCTNDQLSSRNIWCFFGTGRPADHFRPYR